MTLIGCDLHARMQQVAVLDTGTGEIQEHQFPHHGDVLPGEARELTQLRDENTKLKRLVADLLLDKAMRQGVVQKKF